MSEIPQGVSRAGPSQRAVELGVAIGTGLFALIVIVGGILAGIGWGDEGPKAGFIPFYVGLVILLASTFNAMQIANTRTGGLFADWGQLRLVLSVVIPTAIYVGVVPWLGIYLSSMMLIAVFMRWLGGYGVGLIAPIAIGVPIAFFAVFEKWFLVPLPKGPVEFWLGF